jgi:hypothetical protein
MGIGVMELAVLCVLYTPIWLIVFLDILRNEFTGDNKIIWIIVVVLVPVLGPLAYVFIGRKQKIKKQNNA